MFKYLSFTLLLIALCGASVIQVPPNIEIIPLDSDLVRSDFWTKWGPDLLEFMELIDLEQVVGVLLGYLNDPEVLNFFGFILGPKFTELVWEFETVEEFKEAVAFLKSKGYDVESVMNYINAALELPPYEKPKEVLRIGKGISGLIDDIINTLPVEDIKKLFEEKLETNQQLAELFETLNSEEFIDIMKRLSQNPKLAEFKATFEGYGFDFKFLCDLAKEIFGKYYQGIFCK